MFIADTRALSISVQDKARSTFNIAHFENREIPLVEPL